MRVLIHVQHLLGTGHLQRAVLVARACREAGLAVRLVTGGMPVPALDLSGLDAIQLPPIAAADETFRALTDGRGRAIDDAFRARRVALLLDAFHAFRPRAVVTEMYPFGRRKLRFEMDPLIAAAKASGAILVASVRDILQRRPPEDCAWMAEAARAFDHVMVHADPAFVTLDGSFAVDAGLASKLAYTGFVAPPAPPKSEPSGEVLVSAGGGAVGVRLAQTAIAARPLSRFRDAPWRVLVPDPERPQGTPGITVEKPRGDFRELLARCRLSVSQAGYNTVMDILAACVPAVLVPYVGAGQTEQSDRARLLAARGLAAVVAEDALTPESLARVIDGAGAPAAHGLDLDGAAESARFLARWTA